MNLPHEEVSGKLNQFYKGGIMSIFIGVDFLDFKRKGSELANFYIGIINDLLSVEATEGKGTQLKAS